MYSVAKNTSFFTVASVLQRMISFVYFAIIARIIGVENTGMYFFAIAFTAIFTVVADFGLGAVLTREISRDQDNAVDYVSTVLSTKIFFCTCTYLAIIIIANLLGYNQLLKTLIYLSGITMLFDNLHNVFYAVFRANKNLKYESFGLVVSQSLTLLIGTVALLKNMPLYYLILAYTIPSAINAVYSCLMVRIKLRLRISLKLNYNILKKFLIIALPFAIAGIVARLYSYSDSLIMSKMLDEKDLGLWGLSYKFATALHFIPIALSTSVFPVFSSLYINEKGKISELFEKSYKYIFIVAFPAIGGIFVLANPVIQALYGDNYTGSILPLQILTLGLVFIFLTFINGALLNAVGKQRIQTTILTFSLALSVFLNLILIPRLGIVGASLSSLISSIFFVKCGTYFCGKFIKINYFRLFKYLNQTIWPAIVMAVMISYLAEYKIHFVFLIPIGAVIYFSGVILLKAIDIKNIKQALSTLFKKEN
ncbi:MAG: oligosaccharide flippase family protein [bacterium]